MPDHQLSLAIGKEGQNARLAGRLTGWAIDIKSETQLAEAEAAYAAEDWAEGEWVVDEETGEQVWQPAEGGPAVSATEYLESSDADADDDAPAEGDADAEAPAEADTDAEAPAEEASEDDGVQPLDPAADLAEAADTDEGTAQTVEVGDDPAERMEDAPAPAEEAAVDAAPIEAGDEPALTDPETT